MYKKILVPLDGSQLAERILAWVRWLARPAGTPIELLTVVDPAARPAVWSGDASRTYLENVAHYYFPASVPVTTAVDRGEPASVIVDRAKEDRDCLIALATHGVSGMRRWLLGSIASKVVQTAANPLLLVRPAEGPDDSATDPRTVLVPLDGSGLAEQILSQVADLAKMMKLEVHLLRVYTLPVHAFIVADGLMAQGPGPFREELRGEAETYLSGKAEQLRADGLKVVTTALEGDPASEINDIARKTSNNLIAMTTHGRTGIGRWVLGSVAEKVIQHSRDPVLIVRP